MMRLRLLSLLFMPGLLLSGCSGPEPLDTEQVLQLRTQMERYAIPEVAVDYIGPDARLGADEPAILTYTGGDRPHHFNLYDAPTKVLFVTLEELEFFGLEVYLAPSLWRKRLEVIRADYQELSPQLVNYQLQLMEAFVVDQQFLRWPRARKLDFLTERRLAAVIGSALPPSPEGTTQDPAAELLRPPPVGARWALSLELVELSALAEDDVFGAEQVGTASLRFVLRDLLANQLIHEATYRATVTVEGAGIEVQPNGEVVYRQVHGAGDDPVEAAIRQCVRQFVADLAVLLEQPEAVPSTEHLEEQLLQSQLGWAPAPPAQRNR